jgi:group I intron endonuclease
MIIPDNLFQERGETTDIYSVTFYVYLLRDPRNFAPIYVGKGSNGRMHEHWKNMLIGKPRGNPKLHNKLTSIFRAGYSAPIYEVLLQCEDEKACFLSERFFITTFGRETLCNLTDGGGGMSGFVYSKESCDKISKALTGKPMLETTRLALRKVHVGRIASAETLQKMSKALRGKVRSAETRQKMSSWIRTKEFGQQISERQRGENNHMFGKRHSEETLQKMRKTREFVSAATRKKMSESQRDAWVIRRAKLKRSA